MNSRNTFTITEFGIIAKGSEKSDPNSNIVYLKPKLFDELESFILKNKKDDSTELSDLLTIRYKRGLGKVLQAKNYVGVIQMKNGTIIEILPKIYTQKEDKKEEIEETRSIFFRMIRALKDSPFKQFGSTQLSTSRIPLNEIFINMFLEELSTLIKRGIKADYLSIQRNNTYLKGRLKFNEHIRRNLIHKEKFFVEFDEFLYDRPENRLIKTTLLYLVRNSSNNNNLKRIRLFLVYLDEIRKSKNINNDFGKCKQNRLMTDYQNIIIWCRVFLKYESFLNFQGDTIAFALLYPMETIFENYVASEIKKSGIFDSVVSQDKQHYLVHEQGKDKRSNMFKLIPDIYATKGENIYLIDTKWKLLNGDVYKYGISQADMYQLLSYGKVYEHKGNAEQIKLVLLYPMTESFNHEISFNYHDSSTMNLKVLPLRLDDKERMLEGIREMANKPGELVSL